MAAYNLASRTDRQYALDSTARPDSAYLAFLAPYKRGVDTLMQAVIGYTDIPLTKAQPECTLGNFMAEAQMESARTLDGRVVASVVNYGGIRLPFVPPGKLTRGQMYELMPFDNTVAIVEAPGHIIRRFCDHMALRRGWPVAGLRYTIQAKRAVNIEIGGSRLDTARLYKIAVSDYIARGGDDCDFLLPLKKVYTSVVLRDAMTQYVQALDRAGKPLHPTLDSRVRYAEDDSHE